MAKRRQSKAEREAEAAAALEREDRVALAAEILLGGGDERSVTRYARGDSEKGRSPWGLEALEIAEIVRDAREQILAGAGGDRESVIKEHLAKRRMLYRRAVQAGDHRTAAALLKDEGELLGLYRYDKRTGQGERARPLPEWQRQAGDED